MTVNFIEIRIGDDTYEGIIENEENGMMEGYVEKDDKKIPFCISTWYND